MFRVLADNAHDSLAVNHLAFIAHLFNRRPDFHLSSPSQRSQLVGQTNNVSVSGSPLQVAATVSTFPFIRAIF